MKLKCPLSFISVFVFGCLCGSPVVKAQTVCSAVRIATAYSAANGDTMVVGWARGPDLSTAISGAREQARQKGAMSPDIDSPEMDGYYLKTTCDKAHGAIVGAVKIAANTGQEIAPDVYRTIYAEFDDDLSNAKENALSDCNNSPQSKSGTQDACQVLASW